MPRSNRIVVPGLPHHVTQRGNRRQQVFFFEEDYRSYLRLAESNFRSFGLTLLSYCLMPNHIHLLVIPPAENSLRDAVACLHQSYTRLINSRQKWKGHLWQGRFFSCPIQPSNAPFVARYIELNPVRAKLVSDPRFYMWSSANVACSSGHEGKSGFSELFSPTGTWYSFLMQGMVNPTCEFNKELQRSTSTGRPYGTKEFVSQLERDTGLSLQKKQPGRKPISGPALKQFD